MKEVIRWLGEYINQYETRTPLDGLYNIITYLFYHKRCAIGNIHTMIVAEETRMTGSSQNIFFLSVK